MARKIAKAVFSLLSSLTFLFITLFGLCDYLYPDSISKYKGESVEDALCFSFSGEAASAQASAASASASSVQTESGTILAFGILPLKSIQVNFYSPATLIPGGDLFGLRIQAGGLLVTGLGSVETAEGSISPGAACGIKKGDLILRADGAAMESASIFAKMVSQCGGKSLNLDLLRDGKEISLVLTPARTGAEGSYKAGIWVRDGAAGIGTVTYVDPVTGDFAGLGHGICDSDTGLLFPFLKGSVTSAVMDGVIRGQNGSPGEIRGSLGKTNFGDVSANTRTGVYGKMQKSAAVEGTPLPIGLKNEVQTGKATILSTLSPEGKKEYEIEIEEIIGMESETKNFIIRVTDPDLLEKAGGIVQGMSGSPILQNGKIVGAVTHVLVNDSTRGYGIFLENMLKNQPVSS